MVKRNVCEVMGVHFSSDCRKRILLNIHQLSQLANALE